MDRTSQFSAKAAAASRPIRSCRWLLVACCALLWLARAEPPLTEPLDRVLWRFNGCLTFHAGFDHDVTDADLAAGKAAPRQVKGEPTFVPGLTGRALASGVVDYQAGPNLSWEMPGTVLMWFRISRNDRDAPEGYLFPLRIYGGDETIPHALLMLGKIARDNGSHLYLHCEASERRCAHVRGPSTLDWRPDEWHLAAITWRPGSVVLSVDAAIPAMKPAPALPTTSTWFSIAAVTHPDSGLICHIDDVMVFSRPLDHDEIVWVWETMRQ